MKIRSVIYALCGFFFLTCATRQDGSALELVTTEERIPEPVEIILPEEYFIDPIEGEPVAVQAVQQDIPFEVRIDVYPDTVLEKGWYVQIGAYSSQDIASKAIQNIETNYPFAIQAINSGGNVMYRLLLGPLNQGESAAALQRFKSIGYSDAFIRKN